VGNQGYRMRSSILVDGRGVVDLSDGFRSLFIALGATISSAIPLIPWPPPGFFFFVRGWYSHGGSLPYFPQLFFAW